MKKVILLVALLLPLLRAETPLKYWEETTDPETGITLILMPFDTTAWAAVSPGVTPLKGITVSVKADRADLYIVRFYCQTSDGQSYTVTEVARRWANVPWAGMNVVIAPADVRSVHVMGVQALTPEAALQVQPQQAQQ